LKVYSAEGLAAVLGKEGLPKSFKDVYACSCRSAVRTPQDGDPFAKRLHQALRLTYTSISVTGFQGYFSINDRGVNIEADADTVRLHDPNIPKTAQNTSCFSQNLRRLPSSRC